MAGSIQTGADIIDHLGYHDNSVFHFQLKNNVSGKRSATYFPLVARFLECPISGRSSGLILAPSHTYCITLISYCGNQNRNNFHITTYMKVQYNCPNQAKNNGWVSIYNISNMNIYQLDLGEKKQVKSRKYFTVSISPINLLVKFILTDRFFRNVRACSILILHWNVLDPLSRGYEIQAKHITQTYEIF